MNTRIYRYEYSYDAAGGRRARRRGRGLGTSGARSNILVPVPDVPDDARRSPATTTDQFDGCQLLHSGAARGKEAARHHSIWRYAASSVAVSVTASEIWRVGGAVCALARKRAGVKM